MYLLIGTVPKITYPFVHEQIEEMNSQHISSRAKLSGNSTLSMQSFTKAYYCKSC
jgi:hypothetical protein